METPESADSPCVAELRDTSEYLALLASICNDENAYIAEDQRPMMIRRVPFRRSSTAPIQEGVYQKSKKKGTAEYGRPNEIDHYDGVKSIAHVID